MDFAFLLGRPDPQSPKLFFFFFFKSQLLGEKRHLATVSKTREQRAVPPTVGFLLRGSIWVLGGGGSAAWVFPAGLGGDFASLPAGS